MTENRNGFVVESELRQVSGAVERETAKDMRITVGADKGLDTADFVSDMRDFNVTPHLAQNTTNQLSAIDGRASIEGRPSVAYSLPNSLSSSVLDCTKGRRS